MAYLNKNDLRADLNHMNRSTRSLIENTTNSDFHHKTDDTDNHTKGNGLTFKQSGCSTREVLRVSCSQLKCGLRPQIAEQSARYQQFHIYYTFDDDRYFW